MKGAIFIALSEMIEQQHGLDTWLSVLDESGLDGSYIATATYDDAEVLKLVTVICKKFELDAPTVLRSFGQFLFHFLHKAHMHFADSKLNFFDFISSIDGVIHVEVHKLDPEAITPNISVQTLEPHRAILHYDSPRKLCHLAEGLLTGAAEHYGININIQQTSCMHDGASHCELSIEQTI